MSGGGNNDGGSGGRDDGYQLPKSGGSGGGGGGGGGGGDGSPDRCDIVQTAALNSPQPAVVGTLSVGDVLDVVLGGVPGRPVLEVHTVAGAVAGSLTHRGHVDIIDCIDAGNVYKATVVQKSGGMVTLQVQRA